jgi:hypothetical protein
MASWLVPTVTASTMIADLELADKVRCHIGLVEILEAVFVRWLQSHPFAKSAKGWATPLWSSFPRIPDLPIRGEAHLRRVDPGVRID